jgi:sec-independent protein translocase protein TatA
MLGNLTGWHVLIVLAIILLLFGAAKLPALSKSIGQSVKIFKTEVSPTRDDDSKLDTADASMAPAVEPTAEPPTRSEHP